MLKKSFFLLVKTRSWGGLSSIICIIVARNSLERMNKRLLTFFALLILGGPGLLSAQDAHFSQFYANPLYLNPAFAGVSKCPRLNMNYRNQYPVLNVYQTYSASYDQYVAPLNGGVGLVLMRDEAGDGAFSTTDASLVYSYHLKASRKFTILAGFQGTYRQISIDWESFTFPDEIDPYYGFVGETAEVNPGNNTVSTFDLTAGLIGYTERFYFGLVASHLTQPDVSFFVQDRLPLKFTAHMGFTIPLGRKRLVTDLQNYLIPNIVYQIQGPYDQITTSMAFSRGDFKGGLGFRSSTTNPDALVILVGYTPLEGNWGFGYSYDYTISSIANNLGGAHELSLSYQFPCRAPRKKTKAINCPKF